MKFPIKLESLATTGWRRGGTALKWRSRPGVEGRGGPRNEACLAQAAQRSQRKHADCAARIGKLREAISPESLFRRSSRLQILEASRQRMGIAVWRQKSADLSARARAATLADLQALTH